jgi:5-methylcytosine-specific restriction endonuclease McrA
MSATANPIPSSAAASHHTATSPSLELLEARQLRDGLATLLRAERNAAAEFLLALSDFDRRRGWERLGHASLFAFLHVELGLSKGGAFFRQTAARLLQRFPEVIEPLRDGRLCITTVVELARVMTEANRAEVLPRFYGCSSHEAKEEVAALNPMAAPPLRAVVTALSAPKAVIPAAMVAQTAGPTAASAARLMPAPASAEPAAVQLTEPLLTHPARDVDRRDGVEPLTADLRRLHITVDAQFMKMLDTAKHGLSHSIPGASTEQVLKAALQLLLEKQARARGLVKKPRRVLATTVPNTTPTPVRTPTPTQHRHRRTGPRKAIPAAICRAVWQRDGGRCSWPLDSGGVCGSIHRLELDHIVPWARWGGETIDDLRIVCRAHNALAAGQAFGDRCVARYGGRSRPLGPAGRAD